MYKGRIIDVPEIGDDRFKHWTKRLTAVNRELTTGYAFEGQFVKGKAELEVGSYILCFGREGSVKHNHPVVELYRVNDKAEVIEPVYKKECDTEMWALEVRDEIASIVNKAEAVNPLAEFTIEQLEAEIARRKEERVR